LLQLHDTEVGKVKSYYETHKELFEAVQKWEENWKLFLELEVLGSATSLVCVWRLVREWDAVPGALM